MSCTACDTDGGYKLTTLSPSTCEKLGAVYIWIDPTATPTTAKILYGGESGKDAADLFCEDSFGASPNEGDALTVPSGYPLTHRALIATTGDNPIAWELVGNSSYFSSLEVKRPDATGTKITDSWRDLFTYSESGSNLSIIGSNIMVDPPTVALTDPDVDAWTGLVLASMDDTPDQFAIGNTCGDWKDSSAGMGHIGIPLDASETDNTVILFIFGYALINCSSTAGIICVTY